MARTAILLLAAGASSRMRGADKLLQEVDGAPVLRRQAEAALRTGADVTVCLAADRPDREAALRGLTLRRLVVKDAGEGMAASIRAGAASLPDDIAGAVILPADMPEIDAADIAAVLAAFDAAGRDRIARGTSESGVPGHPVVFPARLLPRLRLLSGDDGARGLVRLEKPIMVPLPGRHALTDLDTPEDWAAWRAGRHRP